jgi:hypothetical protein
MDNKIGSISLESLNGYKKAAEASNKTLEEWKEKLREELTNLKELVKEIEDILGIHPSVNTDTGKKGKKNDYKTPLLNALKSKPLTMDEIVSKTPQFPASRVENAVKSYVKATRFIEKNGLYSINDKYKGKTRGPKKSK